MYPCFKQMKRFVRWRGVTGALHNCARAHRPLHSPRIPVSSGGRLGWWDGPGLLFWLLARGLGLGWGLTALRR